MATAPSELSIAEIRNYMLSNDSKVTNHALVKHFKHFLTKPETQNEARKLFKVYVNILSTIRNENNQKYLILRKKYIHELPSNDIVQRALATAGAEAVPSSPSGMSVISENAIVSPMRQPPPYVPPPEVAVPDKNCGCLDQIVEVATIETSKTAQEALVEPEKDVAAKKNPEENHELEVEKRLKAISKESHKENKENIPRFSFSSEGSATSLSSKSSKDTIDSDVDPPGSNVSVKEATRKFNRLVSEEEAKAAVVSPSGKKKIEEKDVKKNEAQETPEVTMAHKKAKEWIVAMARANYQDLSKLATEYPELVKLHDPFTGYTALHWAAKHGNQDVVKLIAGTHKADVNARTNGGYTPLHISMQFGRADVFELLVNVYKANRDLTDWSGNKPLDYSKQSTSVSPSTFSKIQAMRQHVIEGGSVAGSTFNSWRNQGKEKNCSRKRFRVPSDWFFECPSEEDNRSVQQLLGSGKWSHTLASGSSQSPSPAVSPTPSAKSSSSSCRWYDTESDDDEDQTLRH
uniref:Ankyrin repeat domain-containing protein SOWAHC n=1 Tax=Zeugodacus cucurbitae TaxID=28588 RepID=A0A0A1XA40_ZEUCU